MRPANEIPEFFISCDWGTSSLRLVLIHIQENEVQARYSNHLGIKKCFSDWKSSEQKINREEYFLKILNSAIRELQIKTEKDLTGISVILSGMASSTIGICELPYAAVPFNLASSALPSKTFTAEDGTTNPVCVLSGIASQNDVMRGEEIQCLGWILQKRNFHDSGIFVVPGTHSKHILIKEGSIQNFHTYMTGELYDILSHHSILSNISDGKKDSLGPSSEAAFREGVRLSQNSNILNSIFGLRAKSLIENMDANQLYLQLSGILVGTELYSLMDYPDQKIIFACSDTLVDKYQMAAEELGLNNTEFLSPDETSNLAWKGQMHWIKNKWICG